MLQGETGTGKGLVARIIHESGPRAHGPCIEVNCAAIPDTLLEAELFGFEAGAFSEAKRAKPGLFEAASRGTLFLDEIDALPLGLQGKLLTSLESKRVRRLGALREQVVDVKVVAATQVVLEEQVRVGRFRADLYHRLAVVVVKLPPLRARGGDIVVLARALLQRYAAAHRVRPKRLSPAAEAWLVGYGWPGNVRELSHLLERVTLLCSEPILDAATLERLCLPRPVASTYPAPPPAPAAAESLDEAGRIRQALLETGGNVVQAARLLGLRRSTLRYRMQRYGLGRSVGGEAPVSPTIYQAELTPLRAKGRDASSRAESAAASGWEQKLVVVLAIDLAFPQSTDLEATGYEPWTMASRWEQAIMEKVQGFGSVLLQRTASLFTMAFGVPQALEQMPQRAVQAALAVRQLVVEASAAEGREPAPRVRQALHLGTMLVDEHAHEPLERFLAVGETLSVPVRLLGHTAPGEILVSAQLARLVTGWCQLQPRARLSTAGPPERVEAYSVGGLVLRQSPLPVEAGRALSPFVGRTRELATLHALVAQVEGGRGQAVGIVGEAGVGKSRLLYEFRQSLTGHAVTYLEGRCLSYGSAMPYLPVLEVLRGQSGISEHDGPEAVAERVHLALQEVGMDSHEWAPYLLQLLGVEAGAERLMGLSREVLKARTFEALTQMSLRGSWGRPRILAIEDAQWIDQTSEDFLAALVESLAGASILLLTTYRPGYQPPWLGKSYATQIAIQPLSLQDSQRIVQALLQTEEVPLPLAQLILAKAQGNPFFLEELVQVLLEHGVVVREAVGGASLAVPRLQRPVSEIRLPPTVQGVLAARIDRLAGEAKALLHTLAVIGKACSWSLLRRVVGQPEAELYQLLADLQAAEFIYERPAASEPEYTFKHALTQEVAYSSVPREQRRGVHERTAQAIEALFPDRLKEHSSELAHHYGCSGNTAKAVDYLQRAGRQAVERSANVEAISHLTRALELLTILPDTPERTQQELDLQILMGPALMAMKGFAALDVEYAYTRARELCRQLGDTPQLFPVLRGLCLFYTVRAEFQTTQALGEQLLSLARRQQDPTLLLEAHWVLGVTSLWHGELVAARAHLEQGMALYDSQPHRPQPLLSLGTLEGVRGEDSGILCHSFAAWVLWFLGYPDEALERSHQALTLAHELSHLHSLANVLFFAAVLHQCRREGPPTQAQAEAAIGLSTEQGFGLLLALTTILRGWALTMKGQGEEGMTQIRQGLAAFRATGAELLWPYYLTPLAEAYGKAGQAAEGLAVLAEALAAVHKTGERCWEAELYRLKGELLLQQDAAGGILPTHSVNPSASAGPEPSRAAEAEACYRQAIEIARRQQAKSLELRAAVSLGQLWQRQGKREDARLLLAEIYGWFTEGFDTADLREAKALLDELS